MMKKFLSAAEDLISTFSWKEIAVFKVCVMAAGVLLGLAVPLRKKRCAAWLASLVFLATYIPLMGRFLPGVLGAPAEFEDLGA